MQEIFVIMSYIGHEATVANIMATRQLAEEKLRLFSFKNDYEIQKWVLNEAGEFLKEETK